MKAKLLCVFLMITVVLQAQITDFVTGLDAPNRLIIDNDIIYVKGTSNSEKIYEIDLSNTPASVNILLNSVSAGTDEIFIEDIKKNNDTFYISYFNDTTFKGVITSFDINNPTILNDIITDLGFVPSLAIKNNELFFVEENLTTNEVSLNKIDVTNGTPSKTSILTGLANPQDMEFNGDLLFMSDKDTNKIYSVDTSLLNPMLNEFLTGVNARGIFLDDSFLYFSDNGAIKKVAFTDPSNVITEVEDFSNFLRDVVVSSTGNLYMPEEDLGKIVVADQNTSLPPSDPSVNTNLTEEISGLVNPNHLLEYNGQLYIQGEGAISVVDLSATSLSPTPIYTTPAAMGNNEFGITNFTNSDSSMYIIQEEIDAVNDVFVSSTILKIDLDNTSAPAEEVLSQSNFIGAVAVIGNELFFNSEIETSTSVNSTLKKIDLTDTNTPPIVTDVVNGFSIVDDFAVIGSILYLSDLDFDTLYSVDTSLSTPTLQAVTDSSQGANFIKGLFSNGTDLFLANENVFSEIPVLQSPTAVPNDKVENLTYEDNNNGTLFYANFRDGVIIGSKFYLTLKNQGLIVSAPVGQDFSCTGFSSTFNEIVTGFNQPGQVIIDNNDLYVAGESGISKFNINTGVEEVIYTSNSDEFIFDFSINATTLYFASGTFDLSSNDIIKSELKSLDLNNVASVSTLLTYTAGITEKLIITGLELLGNEIYLGIEDGNINTGNTEIRTFNINTNAVNSLASYNFYITSKAFDGTTFYFGDDEKVLTVPLANIGTTTPQVFLENVGFISALALDDDSLYLGNGNEIQKVALNSVDPENQLTTVAVNGTYNFTEPNGSLFCSSFEFLRVANNVVYGAIGDSFVVGIDASNEVLSNSDISIKKEQEYSLVITDIYVEILEVRKSIKAELYNLFGQLIGDFKLNKFNHKIYIENLSSGLYLLKIGGETHKIIKK